MSYQQAREDHEYLWGNYNGADDMTGAYVDSEDLDKLLKSPTKKTAEGCYKNQIIYWCQTGPDLFNCKVGWETDPVVLEIAERYGCEDDFKNLLKLS